MWSRFTIIYKASRRSAPLPAGTVADANVGQQPRPDRHRSSAIIPLMYALALPPAVFERSAMVQVKHSAGFLSILDLRKAQQLLCLAVAEKTSYTIRILAGIHDFHPHLYVAALYAGCSARTVPDRQLRADETLSARNLLARGGAQPRLRCRKRVLIPQRGHVSHRDREEPTAMAVDWATASNGANAPMNALPSRPSAKPLTAAPRRRRRVHSATTVRMAD
jgi:hypothetical protein